MPIDRIQPLQGLNRMSLSGLSDRERKQWYTANQNALSKYNPAVRDRIAEQIYKNQLYVKKFGETEFYRTEGLPGGAAFRNKQLENRLIEEAWRNTFKSKHNLITDIDTGIPYTKNGQPMIMERDDSEVNVSDEWYQKYNALDPQAKRQLMEAYEKGEWKPEMEIKNNNVFSKYGKFISSLSKPLEKLTQLVTGKKSDSDSSSLEHMSEAGMSPIEFSGIGFSGTVASMIGKGRDYYNKSKNQAFLDKLYDESSHRIANSDYVSQLKKAAYLDNGIVGADDEETKKIFYDIITPSDPDTSDYEDVNLGIPTYAAYFDGGKNIQSEVKDISIDQMREIIATKYAMERAGIPKAQVRDMLEREAQKHVANNESWWKGQSKFAKDVLIAASAYTADKWNGIKNVGLMA